MKSNPRTSRSSVSPSRNSRTLILSVDDERSILTTRQAVLENAGYKVLSASNGEEALRIFAANGVDLVLLDYLMPGSDGGVVAHEMKRRKPVVPVILVSASPIPEETLHDVDCFLEKGQWPSSTGGENSRVAPASPECRLT